MFEQQKGQPPDTEIAVLPDPRQFTILMADGTHRDVKGHEAQVSVNGALTIVRAVQVSPTQAIQIVELLLAHGLWNEMTEVPPPAFSSLAIH